MTIDQILDCVDRNYNVSIPEKKKLAAEVRRLREENAAHDRLIDMQHKRVTELVSLWANTVNRHDCLPDLGNLAGWATEEINRLRERERVLSETLQGIRDARPSEWGDDMQNQFEPWAQNRARAALESVKE